GLGVAPLLDELRPGGVAPDPVHRLFDARLAERDADGRAAELARLEGRARHLDPHLPLERRAVRLGDLLAGDRAARFAGEDLIAAARVLEDRARRVERGGDRAVDLEERLGGAAIDHLHAIGRLADAA